MRYPTVDELLGYYDTVSARVSNYLRGRSVQDIEDVTQTIMIKFVKAIKTFRRDSSIETLLYVVTQRGLYDYLRKRYHDDEGFASYVMFRVDLLMEQEKMLSNGEKDCLMAVRRTALSRIKET